MVAFVSVSARVAANAVTVTPTLSSWSIGECVVIGVIARSSAAWDTSSGWTIIGNHSISAARNVSCALYARIMQSGDVAPALQLVGAASTTKLAVCATFSGVHASITDATSTVSAQDTGDLINNGDSTYSATAPTITTATANAMVIRLFGVANSCYINASTGGGESVLLDGANLYTVLGDDAAGAFAYKAMTGAGSAGTALGIQVVGGNSSPPQQCVSISAALKDSASGGASVAPLAAHYYARRRA